MCMYQDSSLLVWLQWISFSPSSPHSAVLFFGIWKGVYSTPVFWLLLNRAGTASLLSLQHSTLSSRLGVGKILGGDIARTIHPNWSKEYSIPYNVSSNIKAKGKEKAFITCDISFWSKSYMYWTLLLEKCLGIICWWEIENKIFCIFILLYKTAFILTHDFFFHVTFCSCPCWRDEWQNGFVGNQCPARVNALWVLEESSGRKILKLRVTAESG